MRCRLKVHVLRIGDWCCALLRSLGLSFVPRSRSSRANPTFSGLRNSRGSRPGAQCCTNNKPPQEYRRPNSVSVSRLSRLNARLPFRRLHVVSSTCAAPLGFSSKVRKSKQSQLQSKQEKGSGQSRVWVAEPAAYEIAGNCCCGSCMHKDSLCTAQSTFLLFAEPLSTSEGRPAPNPKESSTRTPAANPESETYHIPQPPWSRVISMSCN